MPVIPESVKTSLWQRLTDHAHRSWSELVDVRVRYRGQYAYIDGELADGDVIPLVRLSYTESEDMWDFYIYQPSRDTYSIGIISSEEFTISGPPEQAVDSACEIHLKDPLLN